MVFEGQTVFQFVAARMWGGGGKQTDNKRRKIRLALVPMPLRACPGVAERLNWRFMPTLDWIGKKAVVRHHAEVPFHLLKEEPDLSCGGEAGTGNLIVQGDNLKALRALLPHYGGHAICLLLEGDVATFRAGGDLFLNYVTAEN